MTLFAELWKSEVKLLFIGEPECQNQNFFLCYCYWNGELFIVVHSVFNGDEFKTDINYFLFLFVLTQLAVKKDTQSVLNYSNSFNKIQALVPRSLPIAVQHILPL